MLRFWKLLFDGTKALVIRRKRQATQFAGWHIGTNVLRLITPPGYKAMQNEDNKQAREEFDR
jgi:hypothetical protein